QFLFLLIDAFQNRSGSEKFESAAHGETFVGAVINTLATANIQRGETDSAAQSCLDRRDLTCCVTSRARRGSGEQQNQNGYHRWYAGWPSFTATKIPRQVAHTFPPALNVPSTVARSFVSSTTFAERNTESF